MGKRILIADDSALILKYVKRLIEQEPAWVVTGQAANGREAIEKVSELNPDLVILDLSMPVMNGLDAACELSRIKPDLPLVMFTNNPEIGRAALPCGFRAVVAKTEAHLLIGVIRNIFAGLSSVAA